MNPDIKARWVAALRSGEYVQGERVLHEIRPIPVGVDDSIVEPVRHEYCCLGVLCDIALKDGVVKAERRDSYHFFTYYSPTDDDDRSTNYLPDAVIQWAGLEENNPKLHFHNVVGSSCVSMNDDLGRSFGEIATAIEESL